MNWLPDRKVFAGGLVGVLTWLLVFLANKYLGWTIPPEIQSGISGALGLLMAYAIPPSIQDTVTRVNDDIVKLAAADPNNPTSERTMVLPAATKVVAASVPAPTVATPPALGPQPIPPGFGPAPGENHP